MVYRRFVLETRRKEIERDGQVEQITIFHSRSTEGPAAPGEYLLVVVMGAAQVKAEALSGELYPGALLVVNGQGRVTAAEVGSPTSGRILGTALEAAGAADVADVADVADAVDGEGGLVWVLVMPR